MTPAQRRIPVRSAVRALPVIGSAAKRTRDVIARIRFRGSSSYWERRYRQGGTSGSGSYGELAAFKAEFLNGFVARNGIVSVIELGCGDGAQLALARYPTYLGLDVSRAAIERCRRRFAGDPTKEFRVHHPGAPTSTAELALSLDVIYHLVEDSVFDQHMADLFDAADRWVIAYSSNEPTLPVTAPHIRHRRFTDWVDRRRPEWHLALHVANRHPYDTGTGTGSFADFYVFERQDHQHRT